MFSSTAYTILAGVIFFGMLIPLLMLSEFIFVEPFFTFHIPHEQEFGFILILTISIMSAIVIPMNIYRIRILQKSTSKIGGSVLGSSDRYLNRCSNNRCRNRIFWFGKRHRNISKFLYSTWDYYRWNKPICGRSG